MPFELEKRKTLVIAEEYLIYKLVINNRLIDFNYIGVEISATENRIHKINQQANKAAAYYLEYTG